MDRVDMYRTNHSLGYQRAPISPYLHIYSAHTGPDPGSHTHRCYAGKKNYPQSGCFAVQRKRPD